MNVKETNFKDKLLGKTIYIIDNQYHKLKYIEYEVQSAHNRIPLNYKIYMIEDISYVKPAISFNGDIVIIDVYNESNAEYDDVDEKIYVCGTSLHLDEYNKSWFTDYDMAVDMQSKINSISDIYCKSYNLLYNKYHKLQKKMEDLDNQFLEDINNLLEDKE